VPTIYWTVLVWLTMTGPLTHFDFLPAEIPANGAFFVAVTYALYYIILEPVAGVKTIFSILFIYLLILYIFCKIGFIYPI